MIGRPWIPNDTPWVGQTLRDVMARLENVVDPDWLPHPSSEQKRRLAFAEYSCGSYSCVLPTQQPGVVLKLTTDLSEA